jgi:putative flippase GtrA
VAYSFNFREWSGEITRLIRFALVGVLSTTVDFGLLLVLSGPGQMPVLIANSISYSTGIAISFTLNRVWTFSDAREDTVWSQLVRFLAVSLAALAMNNGIVWLLGTSIGPVLGQDEAGIVVAKIVATLVVLGWRFFANSRWTFRRAPVAYAEEPVSSLADVD